jgi:hypothetical protein
MRAAQLEQLVRRQLVGQPPLRAPAGLEARVLAAIAAQSRPWYSRGFQHWPLAWKALFLLLAVLLASWVSGQSVSVFDGAGAELARHGGALARSDAGGWWGALRALARAFAATRAAVPTGWLEAAAAVAFVSTATLLGGAVFAYQSIAKENP